MRRMSGSKWRLTRGAGGSYSQATSDSEEEDATEEKRQMVTETGERVAE